MLKEIFTARRGLSIGVPKLTLHDKTNLMEELAHTELAQEVMKSDFNGTLVNASDTVITPHLVTETRFGLNETGVTVEAASYSASGCQSCDPTFRVPGPFGFVIVDRKTKTILGMGQVNKMEGQPVTKRNHW